MTEGRDDKFWWLIDTGAFTIGANIISRLDRKPEISFPPTVADLVAIVFVLGAAWSVYNLLKPAQMPRTTISQPPETKITE